jgi:hypothetical protein
MYIKIFFIYKNIFYLLYILSEILIHTIKILIKLLDTTILNYYNK